MGIPRGKTQSLFLSIAFLLMDLQAGVPSLRMSGFSFDSCQNALCLRASGFTGAVVGPREHQGLRPSMWDKKTES